MLSYEIPMGLCVLIMIIVFATTDAGLMVNLQGQTGLVDGAWGIFYHPLLAIIFFICVLAECNRAPFDLAEAEQELVGGFHTEYSSMKWALFFLGEYMHMITGSAFFVVLFLGGWDLSPFFGVMPILAEDAGGILIVLAKAAIFAAKVGLLLFIMMWIRWTLPRFRFDQLMKLAWRGMIPLTLVMLIAVALMTAIGLRAWWWHLIVDVTVMVTAALVSPLLPQGPAVNRRVPLEGSRFSPATT
jgi:NADH-quinone oxidoreductase subunit H